MKSRWLNLVLALLALSPAWAAGAGAIVDGPNYAFIVSAPKGWKMTSTGELQAAFHPVGTKFEKSAVIMYVRSADKGALRVASIAELNRLDLQGIQKDHPAAASERVGAIKTPLDVELPLYSFSGGGYSELVAYAEEGKTITVFVASADQPEQLKTARAAFDELVTSYVFLTDSPKVPGAPVKR